MTAEEKKLKEQETIKHAQIVEDQKKKVEGIKEQSIGFMRAIAIHAVSSLSNLRLTQIA